MTAYHEEYETDHEADERSEADRVTDFDYCERCCEFPMREGSSYCSEKCRALDEDDDVADAVYERLGGVCPSCRASIAPDDRGESLRCSGCNWSWEPPADDWQGNMEFKEPIE